MITAKQMARSRWVMLGVLLALVLYYFFVFRPLSDRAESLDKPWQDNWRDLVNLSTESRSVRNLELEEIHRTQNSLRAAWMATENLRSNISARVGLETEIRAKMDEPFFLIDFQNERQKRIEQVAAMAKTRRVTLEKSVLASFPEYTTDTRDGSILWAQLALVHHVLTLAINSEPSLIKNISVPAPGDSTPNNTNGFWQEIPVRIELVAPTLAAGNFLSAIPLRADEIKTAGLPESLPGKPALFLDRVLMQKQSPQKLDEVSLDVVVSGFVRPNKESGQSSGRRTLP